MSTFEENLVVGNTAKDLVRTLLESVGYTVYPFGYESYLTRVKDLMHAGNLENNETAEQLRTMPDLVVACERWKDLELVEVKYRSRRPDNVSIDTSKIQRIKKYWPTAVLVWVLPFDEVFYTTELRLIEIESKSKITDIPENIVTPIWKVFPRIILDDNERKSEQLQKLAKELFKDIDMRTKWG